MSHQLTLRLSGGPTTVLMLIGGGYLGRGVMLVSLLHIKVHKILSISLMLIIVSIV